MIKDKSHNELPAGWANCNIEDISISLRRGPFGSAIKKSFFVKEGYKVYEQRNAIYRSEKIGNYFISENKFNELADFEVKPLDFILSCSGTIGKLFQIPEKAQKGIINQALMRIRIDNKVMNYKFFSYLFDYSKFIDAILVESRGVAIKNIVGIKEFKNVEIKVPPLNEQNRIVDKLDKLLSELDKGKEQLKTSLEQLKVYRQSILKHAFAGKLTNDIIIVGKLPKGWAYKSIEEISTVLGDGLHGTPKYIDYGEFYFINGNNLSDGIIEIKSNTKRVSKSEYEKYKKPLNENTVFVSINGSIGYTAFFNNEKVILGKSACYFNVIAGVSKSYVRYYLKSNDFNVYANKEATGSTIKNLGLKAMREFQIPLPPTIEEQNKIVQLIEAQFSICKSLEEAIEENISKSELIKQGLLQMAFKGELVDQNLNDEPATELLERIKREQKYH